MPVPSRVHPLVGGHSQADHLVELAHSEAGDPDEVKDAHDEHEEHPRTAGHGGLKTRHD